MSDAISHPDEARTTRTPFTARSFLCRLALAAAIILIFALLSRAGGPKSVAGTSYFLSTTTGQPLVWPQGLITYYTDQGDLSPILPNASANAFVADAFSQWTSVPTAAVSAINGGQLAEDVNGSNVTNAAGTISMPVDIQPTATGTPSASSTTMTAPSPALFWAAALSTPARFITTPSSAATTATDLPPPICTPSS